MRLPDDHLYCPECGERLMHPMDFLCEDCLAELEEESEEDE
jgi:hypothetical protein